MRLKRRKSNGRAAKNEAKLLKFFVTSIEYVGENVFIFHLIYIKLSRNSIVSLKEQFCPSSPLVNIGVIQKIRTLARWEGVASVNWGGGVVDQEKRTYSEQGGGG